MSRRQISTWQFLALLALGMALPAAAAERVLVGTIPVASGVAGSTSFSIVACVDGNGTAGLATSPSFQLISGCAAMITSIADDDDGDGVPSVIEQQVANGDGNHDGRADALQDAVASVLAGASPITAEVESGQCAIFSARGVAADFVAGEPFSYRAGLVELSLRCATPAATVRLFFHDAGRWPPTSYRAIVGDNGEERSIPLPFSADELAGSPIVLLTIQDGAPEDRSGVAGEIVVLSGPAGVPKRRPSSP